MREATTSHRVTVSVSNNFDISAFEYVTLSAQT